LCRSVVPMVVRKPRSFSLKQGTLSSFISRLRSCSLAFGIPAIIQERCSYPMGRSNADYGSLCLRILDQLYFWLVMSSAGAVSLGRNLSGLTRMERVQQLQMLSRDVYFDNKKDSLESTTSWSCSRQLFTESCFNELVHTARIQ